MLYSHKNQSTKLHCKSIDWFLYEWNIVIEWINLSSLWFLIGCIPNKCCRYSIHGSMFQLTLWAKTNVVNKTCLLYYAKSTHALCINEILFCLMYFALHWQFHAKLQNNSINTETFNIRLGGRNLSSFR